MTATVTIQLRNIDADVWHLIRVRAAQDGIPANALVNQILGQYLETNQRAEQARSIR